ncbi:MAG: hypothetical protein GY861_04185, partial [bacterium]|nr:hypothetical protein [bacterium]
NTSGTPYLSCEDIEMSDSTMPKIHSDLGSFPEFTKRLVKGLVSVTGQTKSGPETSIQVCVSTIESSE